MAKVKIKIDAYSGYGNKNKIYCLGRVLVNKEMTITDEDSFIKHAVSVYKNAESDEIPWQKMQFTFAGETETIYTNTEGFYLIEDQFEDFVPKRLVEEIQLEINTEDFEKKWLNKELKAKGKIFYKSKNAKFGVISDIDDTILKTDVLSTMKWKIFYNTLFIKASKRMPIKDANIWYQKLSEGTGNNNNPFFYVSHSPWNLYNYLQEFLKINEFPEGPVLLRDFGLKAKDALQDYENHKRNEVIRILKMYPKLNFILIGDGGEKDAHIYLKLKKRFPKRIAAIFIHRLGNKAHQAKIEAITEGHEDYFFFVKNAKEATEISKKLGFIAEDN
ncbi:MAG: phosphatase domain-containing protein [Chitinophagales bacterium]